MVSIFEKRYFALKKTAIIISVIAVIAILCACAAPIAAETPQETPAQTKAPAPEATPEAAPEPASAPTPHTGLPEDNRIHLFIGQDLGAAGGLPGYSNG